MNNSTTELITTETIETFARLFSGRTDAHGTWNGGSVKRTVDYYTFERHLSGLEPIGIYPLMSDSTVWWGCSDIDEDDIDKARNLQLAMQVRGVPAFIERTRRGFHVWVFVDEPVPASVMRRAFLSAHQAVNVPPKEVNPKQEVSTGLGNYVRLPYPIGPTVALIGERVMLDSEDRPIPLELFLSEATENLATLAMLQPLADMHKPRALSGNYNLVASPNVEEAFSRIYGYKHNIVRLWREGPGEGFDRSGTLHYLVNEMSRKGVGVSDAYTILVDADKRWGKYYLRLNGENLLKKIIDDVYGEAT